MNTHSFLQNLQTALIERLSGLPQLKEVPVVAAQTPLWDAPATGWKGCIKVGMPLCTRQQAWSATESLDRVEISLELQTSVLSIAQSPVYGWAQAIWQGLADWVPHLPEGLCSVWWRHPHNTMYLTSSGSLCLNFMTSAYGPVSKAQPEGSTATSTAAAYAEVS